MKRFRYVILLTIVSSIIHFYFNELYTKAIANIFFQLIASGLIGWVFAQFYNKYYSSSRITWWARFYFIMIIGAVFYYLFDPNF